MREINGSHNSVPNVTNANGLASDINYIQTSWQRCRDKYKIEPQRSIDLCVLTEKELREKRQPLEQLLANSQRILERVRRVAKESGYCVLIGNVDGVTVQAFTDSDHDLALQSRGIRQGTLWQEAMAGTNGLGTCLEEQRPVTVDASEHYGANLQCFSCSAAPLVGADGAIVGGLNMSTFANGNRRSQALALNLVTETANEIEALIFKDAYSNQHIVSFTGATHLNNAFVAFNESGTIVAATTPALIELNCRDRYELVGRNILDAFQMTSGELNQPAPFRHRFELNGVTHQFEFELHQPVLKHQSIAPTYANKGANVPVSKASATYGQTLLAAAGSDPSLVRQAKSCMRILDRGVMTLIQGETGTGKEVWAKALHDASVRRDKPFVAVNCAAIPETLIESELFGYGAGTFTGGLKSGKKGKIEASNGGTLFLDEIGDMPVELQARLLRVLAEKEIIPLGEVDPIPIDINVICATHRDLEYYVRDGRFREDLYYRISVFKVLLPPLRDRQDKPRLIQTVLRQLQRELGEVYEIGLTPDAEQALLAYSWPGNIRQLKNVLHCAACMREGKNISVNDLPEEVIQSRTSGARPDLSTSNPSELMKNTSPEKQELISALEKSRWNVTRAAKAMGVSRSTLHRRIKAHDLLPASKESEPLG